MHRIIPALTLALAVTGVPRLEAQQLRTVASSSARAMLARDLEARVTALERVRAREHDGSRGTLRVQCPDVPAEWASADRRAGGDHPLQIEHPVSWELETLDYGGTADEAWQLVRSSMVEGAGRNLKPHVVRCLLIWRRQPGGSHRIHLDIWTEREHT